MAIDTQELEQVPPETEVQGAVPVEIGPGDDVPIRVPTTRLAIVAALPTLAAAMMTGGLFVGAGGRIWAAVSGVAGIALAVRARRIRRPGLLYLAIVGGIFAIGLISTAATGLGNIFDLGAEMRRAIEQSDLLRPPVDFQPGWHAITGWIMGAVGFAAAWLALEVRRPALGILVTLPIVGLGAISLPESQQLATGIAALVLFVLSLAVLSGAESDADGSGLGLAFEVRKALRALPLVAIVTVGLFFASKSDFLFPAPKYDPAQEAKKPKTIPLSEVEDRVLFSVEAGFTGPWKMGSLDVYDASDGSWRLPPFSDSELKDVPESGIVVDRFKPGVKATFTVRGLGGAILPGLPNTVGIVAIGPTLAYDDRTGNIRISQGEIRPGFQYVVAGAGTPTITALNKADTDYPDDIADFLEIPDPPPGVESLLSRAPQGKLYDRLDFLRQHVLKTVAATGAGVPVNVTPERVDEILIDREATPYEIVASQAMLARWAGIPSRIGYGFDGGDQVGEGLLEVRPKHGANFLEVYFNGFGWLPVQGDPLQAKESLSDTPQQFNPNVRISEDVSVRLFFPVLTESDPSFIDEFRVFAVRVLPPIGGLLLIYYLWPLPYKTFRRARRRTWAAEEGAEARVALAYAEWRDTATDFGYRHQTDTPLMFLKHVIPDDEHVEFAWLVTRSLWGDMRGRVTPDDALAAEELSRSLRRRLGGAHPATMRFVAALSRLSVRYPYAPGIDVAAKSEGHKEPVVA